MPAYSNLNAVCNEDNETICEMYFNFIEFLKGSSYYNFCKIVKKYNWIMKNFKC